MPNQFRRCATCSAPVICELSPHTTLPCPCGGELRVAQVTIDDLLAERTRCGNALDTLAAKCESNAGPDGKVSANGAATHMKLLAKWMRGES
jgi:hypothetical protein